MKSAYGTPKVDSWEISQMWGIGIKRAKKTILANAHNSVQDVTRTLTKRLRTRQEIFRQRWLHGKTYTYTMLAGRKYESGNRVAQEYITDFGYIMIYPLTHRNDAQTFLSCYLVGLFEKR